MKTPKQSHLLSHHDTPTGRLSHIWEYAKMLDVHSLPLCGNKDNKWVVEGNE